MCGIAGFMNRNGDPADPKILREMNATLVHRGPDDHGELVNGAVALGHRRLSIVDLARGHQPMTLDEASCDVVYNGEVYNHVALRSELGRGADSYRTHCDTETVLAAYAELGPASVERLRGMFAFAIHDRRDGTLFLARDRLGIKPLYYYASDGLFAFASEIKALLAHPSIGARVNAKKLPVQLALKYTLDDETLFEGIHRLPPGHTLRIGRGAPVIERYWDLCYAPKQTHGSFEEAALQFEEHFQDAIRVRLMADVPLGIFLSGGVDSSAIAAAMSPMVDEPIRSFSVAFPQQGYNELAHARIVSEHVGTRHREVVLTPEQWFEAWPRMVYHEDEPIAHPSSISLHFLSKLAAEDVKVVLTGEGADELMAGYERYYQTLVNLRYGRFVPGPLRALARTAIDALPDRFMPKRKAKRTALYLDLGLDTIFLDNYAAMSRDAVVSALRPAYRGEAVEKIYDGFNDLAAASGADDLLDRILYADSKTYLQELLMKQDQMSMSASIESRVPFLDHPLVEFVSQLPVDYKLQGFDTKRILRKAVGHTLPDSILARGKMGFPTPTKEWFRGAYRGTMESLLLSPKSISAEYIDPAFTRSVLERHVSGRADLQETIWTLGNLEIWMRIFLEGEAPEDIWNGTLKAA